MHLIWTGLFFCQNWFSIWCKFKHSWFHTNMPTAPLIMTSPPSLYHSTFISWFDWWKFKKYLVLSKMLLIFLSFMSYLLYSCNQPNKRHVFLNTGNCINHLISTIRAKQLSSNFDLFISLSAIAHVYIWTAQNSTFNFTWRNFPFQA